jgi:hypothetical protein
VTGLQIGTTLFATMLLLMSLRVPIAASIFVPGAVGYWWVADGNLLFNDLEGLALARFSVYDLSVIPLFILTGQFATQRRSVARSAQVLQHAGGSLPRWYGNKAI